MKTYRTILLVSLMLLLTICCCTSSSPENELREELQESYDHFLSALESENEERIKSTMSSNVYAKNKNDFANLKASFTSEMKKTAKFMPKISKLSFVKVAHEGATAALIYSKDTKESYQPGPNITFILIKFVNSGSGWKYSGLYSETSSKYNANGSVKQLNLSSLAPEYAIDGKIEPTPPLLPEAEVVGFLHLISLGYKVEVVINNRKQAIINNSTLGAYVKGGLKFGENTLEIKCEKSVSKNNKLNLNAAMSDEEKAMYKQMHKRMFEKIELTIKAKREQKDEEVFKYKPGLKIEGTYTYTFKVL